MGAKNYIDQKGNLYFYFNARDACLAEKGVINSIYAHDLLFDQGLGLFKGQWEDNFYYIDIKELRFEQIIVLCML